MIEITSVESLDEIINNNPVVVVKFHATWCAPCKLYAATFNNVAEDYDESVPFVSIDVDQVPELSSRYGIRSVPSTIVLKSGNVHQVKTGVLSEADLKALVL